MLKLFKKSKVDLGQEFHFKQSGFCPCCEMDVQFIAHNPWLRDHFLCNNCHCIPRERALMHCIKKEYSNYKALQIHESSPANRGHSVLLKKAVENYVETQYFGDKPLGTMVDGFRNEDLEKQTFDDNSFDIVVTSDVMEHIYEPDKAFKEIHRTLKQGGAHIFTTPLVNKHRPSERWAKKGKDGNPIFLHTPEWHGNPVNDKGSAVTFHWGYDIKEYIEAATNDQVEIEYMDNLKYGIRAEYMEVIIARKT